MVKRQGFLFIANHHWAIVTSENGDYFVSMMIQASCFVSFVGWLCGITAITFLCAALLNLGKEQIFIPVRPLQK